jgi:hypothetical protein
MKIGLGLLLYFNTKGHEGFHQGALSFRRIKFP